VRAAGDKIQIDVGERVESPGRCRAAFETGVDDDGRPQGWEQAAQHFGANCRGVRANPASSTAASPVVVRQSGRANCAVNGAVKLKPRLPCIRFLHSGGISRARAGKPYRAIRG